MALLGLHEVFLPTQDLGQSKAFYLKLGYEVTHEAPWGLIQLGAPNGSRLSLVKKDFFPEISLGHLSEDLERDFIQLQAAGIEILADDRQHEPARFSFRSPDGVEISVFQA